MSDFGIKVVDYNHSLLVEILLLKMNGEKLDDKLDDKLR